MFLGMFRTKESRDYNINRVLRKCLLIEDCLTTWRHLARLVASATLTIEGL